MEYAIIVATTENNVIGIDNKMPWHLPADLQFFKKTTLNAPIIMGSNTWVSIGSKPLPKRLNIILSSSLKDVPEGVLVFETFDKMHAFLLTLDITTAFIIGGGSIYQQFLDKASTVYLTRIHIDIPGGMVFFPEIRNTDWQKVWSAPQEKDEKNTIDFTFEKWIKPQ